jgi:hypothetical protein
LAQRVRGIANFLVIGTNFSRAADRVDILPVGRIRFQGK